MGAPATALSRNVAQIIAGSMSSFTDDISDPHTCLAAKGGSTLECMRLCALEGTHLGLRSACVQIGLGIDHGLGLGAETPQIG